MHISQIKSEVTLTVVLSRLFKTRTFIYQIFIGINAYQESFPLCAYSIPKLNQTRKRSLQWTSETNIADPRSNLLEFNSILKLKKQEWDTFHDRKNMDFRPVRFCIIKFVFQIASLAVKKGTYLILIVYIHIQNCRLHNAYVSDQMNFEHPLQYIHYCYVHTL